MEVHHTSDPPQEEENRFGRWMRALNTICNTSYAQIASRVGITKGALSQSIRGNGGVKPETAIAIMEAYHVLAEEQNIHLSITWDKFFLLSWFKGGETIRQANEELLHTEYLAGAIRERNKLRKQVEALKSKSLARDLIAALEENERLKGELARREEGNS